MERARQNIEQVNKSLEEFSKDMPGFKFTPIDVDGSDAARTQPPTNHDDEKLDAQQQALVAQTFDDSTSVENLNSIAFIQNVPVLKEIIKNKDKITSPLIAAKVGSVICMYTSGFKVKDMLAKKEIYELIVNDCAKHMTTSEVAQYLAFAIAQISRVSSDAARFFCTPETATLLLDGLEKYATTPESFAALITAIAMMCKDHADGKRLFSTQRTVSAFFRALENNVNDDNAVQFFAFAVVQICEANPVGLKLFARQSSSPH
jgi:hypothetical protein